VIFDAALGVALARVTEALGSVGIFECLLNLLAQLCPTDSGGAMMFFRHRQPQPLHYRVYGKRTPSADALPDEYYSGPYMLDPNYQRFLTGCKSGVYWMGDVAPSEFRDSEFFKTFYSRVGLSDYMDILWRLDEDTALSLFLERDINRPGFAEAELEAIRRVLPFVFASLARHHQMNSLMPSGDTDNQTHLKVQSTINNFARSVLTRRERQVLFYMLSGYSAVQTAENIRSSEGTVKIHRKNIHRKLEIGSQAELFSLFIQCIPYAQPEKAADPLEVYESTRVTRTDAARECLPTARKTSKR
jgi:DNA-binding CsgD family transcriptional regulator